MKRYTLRNVVYWSVFISFWLALLHRPLRLLLSHFSFEAFLHPALCTWSLITGIELEQRHINGVEAISLLIGIVVFIPPIMFLAIYVAGMVFTPRHFSWKHKRAIRWLGLSLWLAILHRHIAETCAGFIEGFDIEAFLTPLKAVGWLIGMNPQFVALQDESMTIISFFLGCAPVLLIIVAAIFLFGELASWTKRGRRLS